MTQDALLESGAVPKHLQLRERLLDLVSGLTPDAPIPSERMLMLQFDVSRGTVRKAVDGLIAEGVLSRTPGKGTFVAAAPSEDRAAGRVLTQVHLASFTTDMAARGLAPETRVLELDKQPPPPGPRGFFGVAACWRLTRLRLADGAPMAYEETFLRADLLPDFDTAYDGGSVYDLLTRAYDVPIDAAEQIVWAEPADPRRAELLEVEPGEPTMVFERRSTSRGRPVEFVTSWYRADRYSLHMALAAEVGGPNRT